MKLLFATLLQTGSPRILVRGVNWLGDAVMTTPALLRLRARYPAAHIALLTPEKIAPLWRHHPALNEILTFAAGDGLLTVSGRLRRAGFDLALIFPNSPRSAMETWLARIPHRVGYARPWRNFFLTAAVTSRPDAVKMRKRSTVEVQRLIAHNVPNPGGAVQANKVEPVVAGRSHQIHEYLHLAETLGADSEPVPPHLTVTAEEVEAVSNKFGLSVESRIILGLNPGAEYGPAKRWPVEPFVACAREIQQRTGCIWLLFGGKGDAAIAGSIESGIRHVEGGVRNLAGRTSLRELMALLKRCRVLLTNDTGPMHVAAALGTPVVVPFGSTSPELTGPGLPGDRRHTLLKSSAPCAPCFLRECPIDFRCMREITAPMVVNATLQTLRSGSEPSV